MRMKKFKNILEKIKKDVAGSKIDKAAERI